SAYMPPPGAVDQDVLVRFVGVEPSLEPFADPALLVATNSGEFSTFRICVREDHALGANMTVEFRDAGTNALLGSAALLYREQCVPTVDPIGSTLFYTTDCGGAKPECCCTFEWIPDADDEDVVINVVNADGSLQAIVTPSSFTDVINEVITFTVCVNVDHAIGASLKLEFRSPNPNNGSNYGDATLTYDARCNPTITPGPWTTLYSTDCGDGPPRCCCQIEGLSPVTSGGPDNVRIEFESVEPGLNPTGSPQVATGVSNAGFAIFDVCVDQNHALGVQMDVVLYDDDTDLEIARLPVIYNDRCVPTPGDPSGIGTFSVLCGPQFDAVDKGD
ncbi:MAG: hypothetical protein ACC662_10135, partial [Planctomycetota bacterium]